MGWLDKFLPKPHLRQEGLRGSVSLRKQLAEAVSNGDRARLADLIDVCMTQKEAVSLLSFALSRLEGSGSTELTGDLRSALARAQGETPPRPHAEEAVPDYKGLPDSEKARLIADWRIAGLQTHQIAARLGLTPIMVNELSILQYEGKLVDSQSRPPSQQLTNGPEPPPSYEGLGEYVFVSYKREDMPLIAPYLHRMIEWGYSPWYDRGIPGGAEWDALIEQKVRGCRILLVFLTQAAADSKWVRREIKFADREGKPILAIRLSALNLHSGLDIVLNQYQIIDGTALDFDHELERAMKYVRLL